MTAAAEAAVLLRAEIDAVLADWAYHLDHGHLDELAALFTEDALFVTGAVELRGRAQIKIGISNGPWSAPPGTPTAACG